MSTEQGRRGEEIACRHLRSQGYRIVGRNVRLARSEIDIIAEQRSLLAFVEVKQRRREQDARVAVHPDKRHRLWQAASLWLATHPSYRTHACRFDVILVISDECCASSTRIEHIRDAFRPDEG